jgi:putative phosphoribosyl transferase
MEILLNKRGSQVHRVIEDLGLHNRENVFRDRRDAGIQLAEILREYSNGNAYILAIPAGGIPVAKEVARLLCLNLDVAIARKIQLPDEPEAGYGAIGPDDVLVLNDELMNERHLTQDIIERQVEKAKQSVRWREEIFRENAPYPDLKGKIVIIIDDGLASGYTMLAVVRFARERGASKVIVAIPTASERAAEMMLQEADEVYVLNIRVGAIFAVADAYEQWNDIGDEEALSSLQTSR